jgi:hypothetical protein
MGGIGCHSAACTVREMAEATGIEAYLRQQQAILSRPDSRNSLATISCPTGRRGRRADAAGARSRDRCGHRGSRLIVVPDSGHLSSSRTADRGDKGTR